MSDRRIARRYARAAYQTATGQEQAVDVHRDFCFLRESLKESPELTRYVLDPQVLPEERQKAFEKLFKKRLSPLTLQFLYFFDRKGRLPFLPQIIEVFEKIYLDERKGLNVRISSALPLTKPEVDDICWRLSNKFQRDIIPQLNVDPGLTGGLVIQTDDYLIDLSVRGSLRRVKEQMLSK